MRSLREEKHRSNLSLADNQDIAPDLTALVLLCVLVVCDEVVDVVCLFLQESVHPGCWHHTPDHTLHLVALAVLQVPGHSFMALQTKH